MPHGSTRLSIAGAAVRIKTIARAVADSNQALTGVPGGSIDGVGSWVASQVILLTGQTDASENGLWRVAAGAWARTSDLSTNQSSRGVSTFVSEGSSHGNKSWQCTNDSGDDVVGTDDLVWVGGATAYTHPTSAGNKHVPAGGSADQVLKYTSDGTAVWGTDADTVYTHPTSAGNKHVPSGGAADQVLTYDSAGTAVWAAAPSVPSRANALLRLLRDIAENNEVMHEQVNVFTDEFADESDTDAAEITAGYNATYDYYENSPIAAAGGSTTNVNSSNEALGNNAGVYVDEVSQGFQLATGVTITSAKIQYGYKSGIPGSVEMRIETDNAGEPSGTLADAALTVSIGAPIWYTAFTGTFATPAALSASTQYHLVLKLASDPGTNNYVRIGGTTLDASADGIAAYKTGGAWASMTGIIDFFFTVDYSLASVQVQSDAHTASASTDRCVLVSYATLGTGTITYAVSRDGGTTFTDATVTTLSGDPSILASGAYDATQFYADVDISAQPAGTAMKLRATVTGDAKLYGWGMDYNA